MMEPPAPPDPRHAGDRVLILDDEESILEILGQHLMEVGYNCTTTTSAEEALRLLASRKYSLLITDLRMPEMHGLEVVRRAKEIDVTLAVIVVTALMEVSNAIEALRTGADDYLMKPFNLVEIALSVEKALERRRLVLENWRYQHELESRIAEATEDLERANSELRSTKEYLENLINSSADAIVTINPQGLISYANPGATEMVGYPVAELTGMQVARLFAGGPDESRYITRMLGGGKPLQNYETEIVHQAGHQVPVNLTISPVRDAGGAVISYLAICKDITEQKRLENELKEMSIKDSLTGLYNQRHFYDRLESEIERSRRQGHPLSLLLFDVDLFKSYNDCHGHLEGDRVLKAIGDVVLECTREHVDIGFRYGGDEFTVILPEADESQARLIAERIRESFAARRFDKLTLSIGLMSYRKGSSLRSFIRFTDAMMYDAKRKGGNQVFVYQHQPEGAQDAAPAEEAPTGTEST
jgi:diguanylate cyclase (GGDEF)-like protein/PAS domain S-box-containing protein